MDYNQGFCDGYQAAVEAVQRNRDHLVALTAGSVNGNSAVNQAVRSMLQGIDLYIVLPSLKGRTVVLQDNTTTGCK